MKFPYTITVTSKNNELNVTVDPPPVATKEEYTMIVAGAIQKVILDDGIRNTLMGRATLKKELTNTLKDFHKQGMIKPKDLP